MLITQPQFWLVFWPLLLLTSFCLARSSIETRQWFWILASLALYSIADFAGVPWLLLSLSANALMVTHLLRGWRGRKVMVATSLILNLSWILVPAFRYSAEHNGSLLSHLALSFLSLRQLWLLRDVCEARVIQIGLRSYLLFMLFFPHLLMGPLTRFNDLTKQFDAPGFARPDLTQINPALVLIACGLFKKLIIADSMARPIMLAFATVNDGHILGWLEVWAVLVGFQFQLYFDFSAYSDIAIGLALMLGIHLPVNFFSPFRAFDRLDAWRRWHLSFVAFLKYTLFLPLRHYFPVPVLITVVGFASGLWHGMSANFLLWSLSQALLLLASHQRRRILRHFRLPAEGAGLRRVLQTFWVLAISSLIGVFFVSVDLTHSLAILQSALMPENTSLPVRWLVKLGIDGFMPGIGGPNWVIPAWFVMALPLCLGWVFLLPNAIQILHGQVKFFAMERDTQILIQQERAPKWLAGIPASVWPVFSAMVIVLTLWLSDSATPFIYMRF